MMKEQIVALQEARTVMTELQNEIGGIQHVDDLMDDLTEVNEDMQEISDAIAQEELCSELDALEADIFDERIMSLNEPAQPVDCGRSLQHPSSGRRLQNLAGHTRQTIDPPSTSDNVDEEGELAALEAEMAL